jgi:transaldolase
MSDDRLVRLHREFGQSAWLDNLQRSMLTDGSIASLIERGVRGLTSNPTIFQKAIEGSAAYRAQYDELSSRGVAIEDAYWAMVSDDIADAARLFDGVHHESDARDGFVSVEVDPRLAHDEDATVTAAFELAARINRPNVMIKIPATDAGTGAIRRVLARGISVNVTLIFGLRRYSQVMSAHLAGLEELALHDPSRLPTTASVASFFISRVDSLVDDRLMAAGVGHLAGSVAVDQARLAYAQWRTMLGESRWQRLRDAGAQPQRLLWASTSTKNPAYPDTKYVDELIGPDTVNTLPDATLHAFADHGRLSRMIDHDVEASISRLAEVARAGIDLDGCEADLERQGVAAFEKSFVDLINSLRALR